jgi:hypothetical protein
VAAPDLLGVAVEGGELAVARWAGDGPPVLAVHGNTGNHLWWAETVATLDGCATVLAPDLRGRCLSAGLPGPYGLSAHVPDLLGVPLAAPAGTSPAADLAARIVTSWQRLDRSFAGPQDYAAYWRSDPAADPYWSEAVEAALLADLREGPDGRWRAAVVRDAVVADGLGLYDPMGAALLTGPATYVVPAAGGLHDPATVQATVGDAVRVVVVPHVDHDTLLLSDRGAQAVARQILTDRCREHFR